MNTTQYKFAALSALIALTVAGCAHHASLPKPVTVSLQGGPTPTCDDPLVRGFYDITVSAFDRGPANVNLIEYERKSFAFFRAFAAKFGDDGEHLVDHLKEIPKQFVQIVKDDPKTLDSCNNFSLALSGPA